MFEGFLKTVTSAAFLGTLGKGVATAAVVILVSEVAKRSTWLAAAVVALPLMTMLTVVAIAMDQKSGTGVANAFVLKTFLLFWPGLIFFIGLIGLQKMGMDFWPAFVLSVVACFLSTWGFSTFLTSAGWISED
ncbi:MAG: hypothetical protein ABMA14_12600 [Hyphomonadaceae bacterium]